MAVLLVLPITALARGNHHHHRVVNSLSTTPVVIVNPLEVATPASGEIVFTAYLTGFGYPDNTPQNSDIINNSGHEAHAGGTGTYDDPITLASGYVGQTSDYAYGTMFYIPNVQAYFIITETCASCHSDSKLPHFDQWVGGVGANAGQTVACEARLTGNYTVIQNPISTYPVTKGALFSNGVCRK